MVPQGRNKSSNRRLIRRNTLNCFPGGGNNPSLDNELDQAPKRNHQSRRNPLYLRRDRYRRRRNNIEFLDNNRGYLNVIVNVNIRNKRKFLLEKIGYFNPYFDEKEYNVNNVVSKENKIYYKSVYLFIDAFKYAILDLFLELVYRNLYKYF